MKIFYHNDMDGKCSAAIVYNFYKPAKADNVEFIQINYNVDFPYESIQPNEEIVIVDFSPSDSDGFDKILSKTKNIIWIDHHGTAIEKHSKFDWLPGFRKVGVAACELTWDYFMCSSEFCLGKMPMVVKYLGDYDVWAFKYGHETSVFQSATKLYDADPKSSIWQKWLNVHYIPTVELEEGQIALDYRTNYYKDVVSQISYETEFEGYNCIVCNMPFCGSQLFDPIIKDYDILIAFYFDGSNYVISFYTKKDNIDVSKLAVKYGGGGHRQASSFIIGNLPFNKL